MTYFSRWTLRQSWSNHNSPSQSSTYGKPMSVNMHMRVSERKRGKLRQRDWQSVDKQKENNRKKCRMKGTKEDTKFATKFLL